MLRLAVAPTIVASFSGCTPPPPPAPVAQPVLEGRYPPFATRPYEPFSRQAVVAIALREWRLFGSPVDDDAPGTRPPPDPATKPERLPGLWQRVGEYWWLGMPQDRPESAWTGKHEDAEGDEYPIGADGLVPWSAAFVSYVMRIAGAGARFPYSPLHSHYINAAAEPPTAGGAADVALRAERLETYAPQQGDLICFSRKRGRPVRFDALPAGPFPAHCDIVVAVATGQLSVVGGNVDDAVTMKHVPTTPEGRLATPEGAVVDQRYPWFVVLKVLYDADAPLAQAPGAAPADPIRNPA